MFGSTSNEEVTDICAKVEGCCRRTDAVVRSIKQNGFTPNMFHVPPDANMDFEIVGTVSWESLSQLTIFRGEYLAQNLELLYRFLPWDDGSSWKEGLTEETHRNAMLHMERIIQALEAFEMSTILCALWIAPHEPLFAERLSVSFANIARTVKQVLVELNRIFSTYSRSFRFLKRNRSLERIITWMQKTLKKGNNDTSPEVATFQLAGKMFVFCMDVYLDLLISIEKFVPGNSDEGEHTFAHFNRLFRAVVQYKFLESHILELSNKDHLQSPRFASFNLYPDMNDDREFQDSEITPRPSKPSSTLPPIYDSLAQNIMSLEEIRKRTQMTLRKTTFPDRINSSIMSAIPGDDVAL